MNFNTNFNNCCNCSRRCNNWHWENPNFCRPCQCRPNCNWNWDCNRNNCWDNCRKDNDWDCDCRNDQKWNSRSRDDEFGFGREELNNNFPQDFNFNNQFDRFENREFKHDRDCNRDKRECRCNNNCVNFCIPKNAICFLAGCMCGGCCKCRCR